MSRIVDVYKLKNHGGDYTHSNNAERWITELVADYKGWTNLTLPPEGFHPQFDITAEDANGKHIKVEVKFSSSVDLFIEIARANGTPSGIETSTADYWVCVNPGRAFVNNRWVDAGKVRAIPRDILYKLVYDILSDDPDKLTIYPAKEGVGPGSRGVKIDPLKLLMDDGWVASIDMRRHDTSKGGAAIYDVDRILQPSCSRYRPQKTVQ
jgi:hypothetical protein